MTDFFALIWQAVTGFFGQTVMADPFFSALLKCVVFVFLCSIFYGVFLYPFRWCVRALKRFFEGVGVDHEN